MTDCMNTEKFSRYPSNRFSVAPMLDWTDRHCRYFHRQLTKKALLYTEMVTTGAILFGKGDYLAYHESELPLSLQLGGCDPEALARCAQLAEQRGYTEINLNVGCPSDRVKSGRFGACLMADKQLVAICIAAMKAAVSIPVTVKCRIGIDQQDSYAFLAEFIQEVSENGGCDTFIIHARKALLSGLSPKENREIPPLNYSRVYQVKQDFPQLTIAINGGIHSLEEAEQHLLHVDGVMVGRQAYHSPMLLANVDQRLFADNRPVITAESVVETMYPYIEQQLSQGVHLGNITRHMLGLFQNIPGARQWRRYLSEHAHKPAADVNVLKQALALVKSN